jgi:hypothetical protein
MKRFTIFTLLVILLLEIAILIDCDKHEQTIAIAPPSEALTVSAARIEYVNVPVEIVNYVPVETIKYIEVVKEVIREVPVEKIVTQTVVRVEYVPVETIRTIEVIKEIEVIKYVNVPIEPSAPCHNDKDKHNGKCND